METTQPTIESINAGLLADLDAMREQPLTEPVGSAITVRELFAVLEHRGNYDATDHALHTLIARADTDPQARQLLLYAMRPGLSSLAWNHHLFTWFTNNNRADAFCTVIDVFYDALENPWIRRKTTRVAARLLGQVRTQLDAMDADWMTQQPADWRKQQTETDEIPSIVELEARLTRPATAHESQIDLLESLAWARDREIITLDEARFLLAIYSPDTGIDLDSLDLGELTPAAVRKRASRLSQRIARAVTESTDRQLELGPRELS
jgi:hypothetical protein